MNKKALFILGFILTLILAIVWICAFSTLTWPKIIGITCIFLIGIMVSLISYILPQFVQIMDELTNH